jgi:hypothetical protein
MKATFTLNTRNSKERERMRLWKHDKAKKRTYWKKLCVKNEFQLHPTSIFFPLFPLALLAEWIIADWRVHIRASEPEEGRGRNGKCLEESLSFFFWVQVINVLFFDKFIVKFSYRKVVLSTKKFLSDFHPLRECVNSFY